MTDRHTIEQLFSSFNGQYILIIGDVMIDSYIWGKVERISPEAPVPVVSVIKRENRLGGAANVALNVRNLGGIPLLCSITGNDDKAQQFASLMKNEQLPVDGIIKSKHRLTTVKFRIIGNQAQMLRVDEESSQPLNEEETAFLLDKITDMVLGKKIGAIVFEDYDKGVITPDLIGKVLDLSLKYNIPVAVDPKKRNFLSYKQADLFKPNLRELKEGLQLESELSEPGNLMAALKVLHESHGFKTIMVTLSEKGLFISVMNKKGEYDGKLVPAHVRNVADVSGAGDTVIGTAAMCLAAGASGDLMAAICNLAGGLVCEEVGVVPVDKNKLLHESIKYFT